MLPKDDSVNFPQLFPRVPIHPLSLPFSKLGKGTTDQKIYLRIWSTDFFIPVLLGSMTFPGDSVVKNPPADAGDAGSFHRSGRSPGEENDNPHQYSCLERSMYRGAWRAVVQGVTK